MMLRVTHLVARMDCFVRVKAGSRDACALARRRSSRASIRWRWRSRSFSWRVCSACDSASYLCVNSRLQHACSRLRPNPEKQQRTWITTHAWGTLLDHAFNLSLYDRCAHLDSNVSRTLVCVFALVCVFVGFNQLFE